MSLLKTSLPAQALLLLLLLLNNTCSGWALHRRGGHAWWLESPRPYFASTTPTNLTVVSGQTAYLPCRVHMLGEKSVTWMRGRDLHILTVGELTYSADERFQVLHTPETEDWTLQVSATRPWDSGTYKCQVNSHPKIFKDVNLSVMDRRRLDNRLYRLPAADPEHGEYATRIVGESSRYLQAGSSLALECVVTHTHDPPPALLWFRQQRLLDYDSPRGGIAIMLEKTRERTTSRLMMSSVQVSDSGNYTCVPIRAPPASVSVHVTTGEMRAAIQQSEYSNAQTVSHDASRFLTLTFVGVYTWHRYVIPLS
ncbi:V-set and immunoglobulin domain-containing protein 2-like [Penaeus chinensis]|uniref:V-set and immunoglobulin domain-containing protein 2-like n=1 Tax=Penaeus chinensis TaxID=139456 RepID=UPI001FB73610|nr:V-set and immunoglobulin domain-containing protein 2-like [Penaeus chinensis]